MHETENWRQFLYQPIKTCNASARIFCQDSMTENTVARVIRLPTVDSRSLDLVSPSAPYNRVATASGSSQRRAMVEGEKTMPNSNTLSYITKH